MAKELKMHEIEKGRQFPLGATVDEKGVNFSIFSKHATAVELLLFGKADDKEPFRIVQLNSRINKTFNFWHVYVKDLKPGTFYAYRVDGPNEPHKGHIFNKNKVLIDPHAKGNTKLLWDLKASCMSEDNIAKSMRSAVIDTENYDWEGDKPLCRPMNHTVIYEIHVGGFTKSPSSKVKNPGTFSGIIEKIPYLLELGITTVELLPVFDFDEISIMPHCKSKKLRNFWGYNPVSFFSPHSGYCVKHEEAQHIKEFRDMVKALHKAGIGVILDVVFNHTYEGNEQGPFYSFKGIDNSIYYHLQENDQTKYADYSGCGNSLNCNHPIVAKFIIDCLRYWVKKMHVDGFRFDEASVLARGEDGKPLKYPPILWLIELDEILAETKIIAEAWDAAGLYQVGEFPGFRWAEWNGAFRDDIRKFVRSEPGLIITIANRFMASYDIYHEKGQKPINTINFVTAHDGFTMNDLVSYDQKHNSDNGEDNKDGSNNNFSWNCGVEGNTDDFEIEKLRKKQIKNYAALLLLSKGVPMILAGDEVRRTQKGNNNAYCQDNEISYFDWSLVKKNADSFRYWKELIAFRKRHTILHKRNFEEGEAINERGLSNRPIWHGVKLLQPGWNDSGARTLSFTIGGIGDEADILFMFNMYWEKLDFEIPPIKGRKWHLAINTSENSPHDICEAGSEKEISGNEFSVPPRTIVVFISKQRSARPEPRKPLV